MGYTAVVLGVISLMPFIIMSSIAIPKIRPHIWGSLGQKGCEEKLESLLQYPLLEFELLGQHWCSCRGS